MSRPLRFPGDLQKVRVLRLDVDRPAAERGDLDADLRAADPDGPEFPLEDAPPDGVITDADGRRLPEDGRDQSVHFVDAGEQGQLRAQAVFLHDDGGKRGVHRPLFESPLQEVGQDLGRSVVDRRLDDVDVPGLGEMPGLAVKSPEDVRDLGEFLVPAP